MKTKVKICGITNLDDALNAAELGADMLGFIFVKSSPRYISPDSARNIISKLPVTVESVGVFADIGRSEVVEIIELTGIKYVQIHADQTPEHLLNYHVPIIKSFRVSDDFNVSVLSNYSVFAFLLDTFVDGKLGGTGKTFDWKYAIEAKRYGKIFLAGGLNPGNIIEAVMAVQPYAIDVNSGVENLPGMKDKQKLKMLFDNLKKIELQSPYVIP